MWNCIQQVSTLFLATVSRKSKLNDLIRRKTKYNLINFYAEKYRHQCRYWLLRFILRPFRTHLRWSFAASWQRAHCVSIGFHCCCETHTVPYANILARPRQQHFQYALFDSAIKISNDGRFIASAEHSFIGQIAEIIVWDFATREIKHRLRLHKTGVTSLSFSADSQFLASQGCQ